VTGCVGRRSGARAATTISPAIRLFWILLALVLFEQQAAARISGYTDLLYSHARERTGDTGGGGSESRGDSFTQRYSLTLDQRLYPNFRVLAGGLFDKTSSKAETGEQDTDTTITRLKPYVILNFGTRLFSVDGGFDRNEIETKSSAARTVSLINENYYTTVGWKPAGLPTALLQYFRTNTFDKDRLVRDTTTDRFQLNLDYRSLKDLSLKYTGSSAVTMDHLQDVEQKDLSQTGRVSYNSQYWEHRISLSSDYNVVSVTTQVLGNGTGDVNFPISPLAGLSAVTDTPLDVALVPNPGLLDGNFTAGTGINLGLPPAGGDARPRNMGVDFGSDLRVNMLRVWVDQDLRPEISGAFSWDVYTSSDNKTWVLRQTIFPAVFGPFETRFEIRFAEVTARYLKVVTKPLGPTVPFARDYPSIQVTEIQAILTKPASGVQGRTTQTSHRYNLNTRVRLLDSRAFYYEFSYLLMKNSTSPSKYSLSNGLSCSDQFGKIFSGSARFAREDSHQAAGDRVAYSYMASMTAVPLDSLRHSFVYSGRQETVEGHGTLNNSFSLSNVAQVYPGVDASLALGVSFDTAATDEKTVSNQVTAGMTLIPHSTMNISMAFSDTRRKSSGGDLTTEISNETRTSVVSIAYTPVPTLYLFASLSTQAVTGSPGTTTLNYSASWSPFRDGTLHCSFNYNEILDITGNQRQRMIVPNIRWNVSRASYLELTYEDLRNDTPSLKTRNESTTGRLHLSF